MFTQPSEVARVVDDLMRRSNETSLEASRGTCIFWTTWPEMDRGRTAWFYPDDAARTLTIDAWPICRDRVTDLIRELDAPVDPTNR